jgi:hypothetical protein
MARLSGFNDPTSITAEDLLDDFKTMDANEITQLFYKGDWREGEYFGDPKSAWDMVQAAMNKRGYDGIKYTNDVEDRGSVGWVITHPRQVKGKYEP